MTIKFCIKYAVAFVSVGAQLIVCQAYSVHRRTMVTQLSSSDNGFKGLMAYVVPVVILILVTVETNVKADMVLDVGSYTFPNRQENATFSLSADSTQANELSYSVLAGNRLQISFYVEAQLMFGEFDGQYRRRA